MKKKKDRFRNVDSAKERDPEGEAAITKLSEKMIRKYGPEWCYSLSLELQKRCWEDYEHAVEGPLRNNELLQYGGKYENNI